MKTHIVIEGNAFYEIDEECMKKKKEKEKRRMEKQQRTLMHNAGKSEKNT